MTVQAGLSLARVTVASPRRRMDVALPDNLLVGELLPHLLRHAGDGLGDDGERHGGWELRRATGTVLEPTRNLAVQGVRDGELLHLLPRRSDWPELAYDDVVEVIAGGARLHGRSWDNTATLRAGMALAVGVLGLGLSTVLLAGPPWPLPAGAAIVVAVLFMATGIVASRAFANAAAGGVAAAAGLPFGFVGGVLVMAPADTGPTGIGAPNLLLGSAVLVALGVIGYTGVAARQQLFTAGVAIGGWGALAAVLCVAGMTTAGAAALTLALVISMLPGYPLTASWVGRLPVPQVPDRPERLIEDRPMPDRGSVFAAVARTTELLSGLLLATALVSGVSMAVLLLVTPSRTATVLTACAALALLLRGRLFPVPRQRLPLLLGGTAGLALLFLGSALDAGRGAPRLGYLLVAVVVAAGAFGAGLLFSRRPPSPYLGRAADIADVVALMVLIPLACGVVGVFGAIQELFASIGG